jgi:hypothetical protein
VITPTAIEAKSRREYPLFLRAWLRGEAFAPIKLPVGKLPEGYLELRDAVNRVLEGQRCGHGAGYRVESQTRQTRMHGPQTLPVRVVIDTPEDLLNLTGKRREFECFKRDVDLIRSEQPELETWLEANAMNVIAYHGVWLELLRVCAYFQMNPRPHQYARALPIAVHTKFIEGHTGILRRLLDALLLPETIHAEESSFERRFGLREDEPLVRFRLLDPTLQHRFGLNLYDLSVPVSEFVNLEWRGVRCIIVENKKTFLTLPPLPDAIGVFGGGFGVEVLSVAAWLRDCPILYWGDLDAHGFEILSKLRSSFPHAVSVMMDAATLERFGMFIVPGTPSAPRSLPHLMPSEREVFVRLAHAEQRLEQERLDHAYVLERLVFTQSAL